MTGIAHFLGDIGDDDVHQQVTRKRLAADLENPLLSNPGDEGADGSTVSSEVWWMSDMAPQRYVAARTDSQMRACSATFATRSVRTQTIVERSAARARVSASRKDATSAARSQPIP